MYCIALESVLLLQQGTIYMLMFHTLRYTGYSGRHSFLTLCSFSIYPYRVYIHWPSLCRQRLRQIVVASSSWGYPESVALFERTIELGLGSLKGRSNALGRGFAGIDRRRGFTWGWSKIGILEGFDISSTMISSWCWDAWGFRAEASILETWRRSADSAISALQGNLMSQHNFWVIVILMGFRGYGNGIVLALFSNIAVIHSTYSCLIFLWSTEEAIGAATVWYFNILTTKFLVNGNLTGCGYPRRSEIVELVQVWLDFPYPLNPIKSTITQKVCCNIRFPGRSEIVELVQVRLSTC